MLKYKIISILFIFCPILVIGQNIIQNGDFESYIECPEKEGQFDGYVEYWTTYFGTPNYLNCTYYGNVIGYNPEAHSGVALTSCVWFNPDETTPKVKREYLIQPLTSPLENSTYYTYFHIYLKEHEIPTKNNQVLVTKYQDLKIQDDVILGNPVLTNKDYLEKEKWIKLAGCFEAKGGEDLFILGNFSTNAETTYIDTVLGSVDLHFVDDVGLYEISTLVPKDTQMLVGEYYPVQSEVGEYLELDGQKLEGLELFNQEGEFQVEVYLPECGYIGSFTITVIACEEYLADKEKPNLSDSIYCIDQGLTVHLPQLSDYKYYYKQKLLEEKSMFFNTPEVHTIYTYHKKCGKQDSAVYEGIDCITNEEGKCFYVPNIFTPNGDGINDVFDIQGECEIVNYSLQVHDRWGNQVYTSRSIDDKWDGRFKGRQGVSGVYVYHVVVEFIKDKRVYSESQTGTVTILGGK